MVVVAEGVGDFRSRGGMKRGGERAAVVTQRWTMGVRVRVRARRFFFARTIPVARGTAALLARVNTRVAIVGVVTMVIVVAMVVAVVVTESHVEDVAAVKIVVRLTLTVQIRTMTRRGTRRRIDVNVKVKVKMKVNMPRKRMLAAVVDAGRAASLLPRRGKVAGSKNCYIDPVVAVTTKATPRYHPYHPHPTAATTVTIMAIMKQRRKTTMKVTATAAAAMAVAMALVKQHRERAAGKGRRKSGNQRGKRTAWHGRRPRLCRPNIRRRRRAQERGASGG